MIATVLSLMVLTVVALVGGAFYLVSRGGTRRQALLMLVLAAVIAGNVAIWVWPSETGAPLTRLPR